MKKIISFNVNGIRAAMRKGLDEWLRKFSPNIVCIQEIKANKEQFDVTVFEKLGYYHYWFPAEKKGYSGVGVLTKDKPENVKYGCGQIIYDNEGRIIQLNFDSFTLVNVYVPSGSNMEKRLDFKLQFCKDFLKYIKELKNSHPKLIITGDYNICHKKIDIHDPVRNAKVSGFLPVERKWLSQFIYECGLIDSFRHFVKESHHYSWWSYRANARANNKGWRIDYNMVSKTLEDRLKNAYMLPDLAISDHCPVVLEISD